MVGVAASGVAHDALLLTGLAGLLAGAMSMAAGEYVSIHAQVDTENADRAREARELADHPAAEHRELAAIYVGRGLTPTLARQVAEQLMARDALATHARDELGLSELAPPLPLQAALASALSFSVGAALPLAATLVAAHSQTMFWVSTTCLLSLAILGMLAARAGGSPILPGTARVVVWGALALAVTAGAGHWFGAG